MKADKEKKKLVLFLIELGICVPRDIKEILNISDEELKEILRELIKEGKIIPSSLEEAATLENTLIKVGHWLKTIRSFFYFIFTAYKMGIMNKEIFFRHVRFILLELEIAREIIKDLMEIAIDENDENSIKKLKKFAEYVDDTYDEILEEIDKLIRQNCST